MRNKVLVLLLCLFTLLFSGCSEVLVTQPLPAARNPSDREKLEGYWLMEKKVVFIKFADNGVGHLAALDWRDNQFQVVKAEMIISEGSTRRFLCLRMDGTERPSDDYALFTYRLSPDGELSFILPDEDKFKALIDSGELVGSVSRGRHSMSVRISSPPEVVLKILDNPARNDLFKNREPFVLRRLKVD